MTQVKVMGIVNVTPDSFSDGGRFFRPEEAVRRARNLIEDGADVIDLGGESTRPGADPIGWEQEWSRVGPVLSELARSVRVPLSVDTYHPETAARALAAGATMLNCVRSASVPEMLAIARGRPEVELVVPFRLGEPSAEARLGDFPRERLYLDPMIGFDTTREEDLALLRSVGGMARLGRVAVGASRKRIVKKLTGGKPTGKNVGGNVALALWCARVGASLVRVHDVLETVQALKVLAALDGLEA